MHPDYKFAIWDQCPVSYLKMKQREKDEQQESIEKDQDQVRLIDGKLSNSDIGLPLRFWDEWNC